jgi:carbonic anhydrase
MGHAHCGGIRAFADHGPPLTPADSVHRWMAMIEPAATRAGAPDPADSVSDRAAYLARLEQASIAQSLENLLTFSYVADAVKRGTLGLHGAWFDIDTGHVLARQVRPEGDHYVELTSIVGTADA